MKTILYAISSFKYKQKPLSGMAEEGMQDILMHVKSYCRNQLIDCMINYIIHERLSKKMYEPGEPYCRGVMDACMEIRRLFSISFTDYYETLHKVRSKQNATITHNNPACYEGSVHRLVYQLCC